LARFSSRAIFLYLICILGYFDMAKLGFKNCYYDRSRRKILLKEQGSTDWVTYDYKPWCYITDPTGKSNIKDIYKNPVKKHSYNRDRDMDVLRNSSNCIIAESDLRPEVKFMHERYDFENLEVDINDWNVCLFDIEVAGSSKFYDNFEIDIRNLEKKIFKKVELYMFDMNYPKEKFEVFDIEQNCWVKFANSCYVSYEFPAPEKADWPINLITCYSTKTKTRYTFGLKPYLGDKDKLNNTIYIACSSEIDLIRKWLKWFRSMDFDIISGWNSVSYDIPYIINRCAKLREITGKNVMWERAMSPLNLDPVKHEITDRKLEGVDLGATFEIPGLYSIDFMELYKTFGKHDPLPSYSLNFVSNLVLGDQKLKYTGSINEAYKTDWDNFVCYNIKDVILLEKLFDKLKLFELIIEYAFDCIVTLDKIYNKVPTTTGYILRFLHKTNRVLNDKKKSHVDWWAKEKCYLIPQPDGSTYYQNTEWEDNNPEFQKYLIMNDIYTGHPVEEHIAKIEQLWKPKTVRGVRLTSKQLFNSSYSQFKKWPHPFPEFQVKAGYCYDYPGRHDDDMSFDITSSYPHHIMQFNISPEVKVIHPKKIDIESGKVILTDVNEVGFLRTDDAILPNVVKKVFDERKHYKDLQEEAENAGNMELANLYDNRQGVKKIIINSVYGVSLAPGFHLYDPDCARVICRSARVTLRDWLTKYLNEYYESTALIKDVEKEYSTINLTVNNKIYKYGYNDKITVLRNGEELSINACEFNENTDMLGIDE